METSDRPGDEESGELRPTLPGTGDNTSPDPTARYDRRTLFLIFAAVALSAVSVWRVARNKPQNYADQVAAAVIIRPAPPFELLDSDNHLVRLGTFLGRHQIIVLFFDGEAGADRDPNLLRLRERFGELQARGVKAIAISAAIPQRNRAAIDRIGEFPFPLLSDIDPISPDGILRVHRQWGRLTESGKPKTGVFLIDRKGQIPFIPDGPKPFDGVDQAIDAALK